MNKNDTTAVLSPISEQADETEVSSQPANALSTDGGRTKGPQGSRVSDLPVPEKKRPGRSENKRMKIFADRPTRH